jgi:hypothetical protein
MGVGSPSGIREETCAGNEDGTERDRGDSEATSYGRDVAFADDRSRNVFALDDRRADRG